MIDKKDTTEHDSEKKENDFFDRPVVIEWILRIFYFCCALLVIADLVVHRHIYTAIEEVPAFYALYGFIACVVLVLIATQMRKMLMRDEDYYERDSAAGVNGVEDKSND